MVTIPLRCFLFLLTLCVFTLVPARASLAQESLVIATKEAPPFAMKDDGGKWTGISIELWEVLAQRLGINYEYRETDLSGMLDDVESGSADAGVAALTVTAPRESRLDFTHPFYSTGLGMAVRGGPTQGWLDIGARLLSMPFLKTAGALFLVLLFFGVLTYALERRKNDQFGGGPLRGIGSGFWWAAVTMTTVGYGDKAPITLAGRCVAFVWMYAAIITISGFTAAIASSLTAEQLTGARGPSDLSRVAVGTVRNSSSDEYATSQGFRSVRFNGLHDALHALEAGDVEAVVHDIPILQYVAKETPGLSIKVLPYVIADQSYAVALPTGSEWRERINRELLAFTSQPAWRGVLRRYLGDSNTQR